MRHLFLDLLSIVSLLGSLFLFYNCIEFLAEKDYVAGFIVAAIGIFTLRASAEFARSGTFSKLEERVE